MPVEWTSPFTPGLPVPVDSFVGRREVVEQLRAKTARATAGKLQVGFVAGERGVGKSSLASFARFLAERDQKLLGVHAFLGGVGTLQEMIRRLCQALLTESARTAWRRRVLTFFGKHVRQVDLYGVTVEFTAPEKELNRLVNDFAAALRSLLNKIKHEKKGLLLIFDDIDDLARSAEFANWLKSLIDQIALSGKPLPLCLLLVGTEQCRQSLIHHQPSLARTLDPIPLEPWSEHETREFFKKNLQKAAMAVDDAALQTLSRYAAGLPVIAHEIGDVAFSLDRDAHIDQADALRAALAAAEIIGRKHVRPQLFDALRNPDHHTALKRWAVNPPGMVFSKTDLLNKASARDAAAITSLILRLNKLGVLERDPKRSDDAYRFADRLHHAYLLLEAQRAARLKKSQ